MLLKARNASRSCDSWYQPSEFTGLVGNGGTVNFEMKLMGGNSLGLECLELNQRIRVDRQLRPSRPEASCAPREDRRDFPSWRTHYPRGERGMRSEEHTSELQSRGH